MKNFVKIIEMVCQYFVKQLNNRITNQTKFQLYQKKVWNYVNQQCNQPKGTTAYILACKSKKYESIKALETFICVDTSLKDNQGKTGQDYLLINNCKSNA